MDVFPSFWRLEGKAVIVVGGGETALRKLRLVVRTAAQIDVFSLTQASPEIEAMAEADKITLHARALTDHDIAENTAFAIVATEDDGEAEASVALLRRQRIPVNAVDRTALCDFLIPSIVDRNPVVIGIATGGAAPILARSIRETMEAILPARLGALAAFSQRFRGAVSRTVSEGPLRRAFWERFFDGPIAQQVLDGNESAANEAMLTALNGRDVHRQAEGQITIVELPPSEPDLLSLRALRKLQRADILLHDAQFDAATLELVRRDADRLITCSVSDALHRAELARSAGKTVVVLALPGQTTNTHYETLRHGNSVDSLPHALSA
ncbi:MAG: NAD(P)-dependent oxidoreductase [Alphaproteobacteria bacterium]|nr:NAD(P)-dependent oxidoreductase [Alphaproteobacteria bacterium]